MSDTKAHLVPIADVAETIVSGYLFRVSAVMKDAGLIAPDGVWFRVVVDPMIIPMEGDSPFVVSPAFDVLFAFDHTIPGIIELLWREAVATVGHVRIHPRAVFSETLDGEPRASDGWKRTEMPVSPSWSEQGQQLLLDG